MSHSVAIVLIDAIRGGMYRSGELLPNERDLASRLEVSRDVVRDALELLRAEGIVIARRGRNGGWAVADLANIGRVQASLNEAAPVNLRSLLELRRILEPAAAAMCARRATAEDLAALQALVDELRSAVDAPATENLAIDQRFHVQVARAAGNEPLADAVARALDAVVLVRESLPFGRVDQHAAVAHQQALLDAIRTGDPERARREMHRHLAAFEDAVLGVVLTVEDDA